MNAKQSLPIILVADADPVSLAQTIRILGTESYTVFSAICSASAMSAAQKLPLDLLICDTSLSIEKNGENLVSQIQEIPDRNDVPAIFTSAGQEPDIIRRRHDFGFAYHIKKPFDPSVLIEIIERALWMPHLVQTHLNKPHFSLPKLQQTPHSSGWSTTNRT